MTEADAPAQRDVTGEAQTSPLGVLNIDKPQSLTSHDVVARIRRITGERRVGHAGTLDPMATGVLVVCVGRATRIIEYLVDTTKAYRATIRFGVVTDTWDTEGEILEERPWQGLTAEAVEAALDRFRGCIDQVPPMYSALKYQGQPLHRLARRGIEVVREARAVEIYALRVVSWTPPDLVIDVECSKGTYVRSLAHDLGKALGPGAYLADLVRQAVGPFALVDAVPLRELEREPDRWNEHLLPLHRALEHLPAVTVDEDQIQRLAYGQRIEVEVPDQPDVLCAFDAKQRLVAILRPSETDGIWQPHKVLVQPQTET